MKHKCRVRKMVTGNLWKMQCKVCSIEKFGVRFYVHWEFALKEALDHYRLYSE